MVRFLSISPPRKKTLRNRVAMSLVVRKGEDNDVLGIEKDTGLCRCPHEASTKRHSRIQKKLNPNKVKKWPLTPLTTP